MRVDRTEKFLSRSEKLLEDQDSEPHTCMPTEICRPTKPTPSPCEERAGLGMYTDQVQGALRSAPWPVT